MPKLSLFRSHSVRQASALLAITALLSNGLGLVRNLIFYRFIPRLDLDAYFASFRMADLLFNILIVGAITSAVIPIVSDLIHRAKEDQAWILTRQLLTWATIITTVIIGILIICMPFIVQTLLVPGFNPAQQETTILVSRLIMIQALFFSWSFIIGALLNSYKRFAAYALAPLVYNCSLIAGGFLAGRYGLQALVCAVIVGAFLHFLIQLYEVMRLGFRPYPNFNISPELRQVAKLMTPRSISQGMNQVVLLAYTNLSSLLPLNSLSLFSGINDLQTTPIVIVANSLATAYFPSLSQKASEKNTGEINTLVKKVMQMCIYLLLPTAILGLVLRAQISRLYVGIGGAADWGLTYVAISTFSWFMVGIVPWALVAILSRVFYATNDTRTPMIVTICTSIIGIGISWFGIHRFHADVSVLALTETAIATSQALLYVYILHKRGIITITLETLIGRGGLYIIGSFLLGVTSWITLHAVNELYDITSITSTNKVIGLFIQTLCATLVGLYVYFRYSNLKASEELAWVKQKSFLRGRTI